MDWQDVRWQIPLETQPTALAMGMGRHGVPPVERYTLGEVWCLHLYRYRGRMRLHGLEFPIQPGYISLTPPQVQLEHRFDEAECVHMFSHFTLPAVPGSRHTIPAMQDAGADFGRLNAALEEAVGAFPLCPRRAEVRLWDILWQLTGKVQPADPSGRLHPAVRQTLQAIELRLGEPLTIAALASEADLSHSHLSRLFRAEVGTTLIGYLQRRRLERARHLLVYSSLPPRAIAALVGIPDLHLFNKTLRRALGRSPRALREQAQREEAEREEAENKVQ